MDLALTDELIFICLRWVKVFGKCDEKNLIEACIKLVCSLVFGVFAHGMICITLFSLVPENWKNSYYMYFI